MAKQKISLISPVVISYGKIREITYSDAAALFIQRVLAAGIKADYVLMATWLAAEPMVKAIPRGRWRNRHGKAFQTT